MLDLPDWADAFLAYIEDNGSVMAFSRLEGSPGKRTIYDWIERSPDLKARFSAARAVANQALEEEQLEIADTRDRQDPDDVQHRKLRIWTRQQVLANRDPSRYGPRQHVQHSGGLTVQVVTGVPPPTT
jgi:hypothetical protein